MAAKFVEKEVWQHQRVVTDRAFQVDATARDAGGTGERGGQREENRRDMGQTEDGDELMVEGVVDPEYPPAASEPIMPPITGETMREGVDSDSVEEDGSRE